MKMNRIGQVTIFVIIAIVIVAVIGLFVAFRENLFGSNVPASLQPVYSRYGECIGEEARNGISMLMSQGGRIDIGDLGYASEFNPFSEHLNFLGFRIPYWYGFTENNLVINNVPSLRNMEKELSDFISGRVNDCDFSDFIARGFVIDRDAVKTSVSIKDGDVAVSVDSSLAVSFEDDSAVKSKHEIKEISKLGALYKSAVSINNYERSNLFLENYALDALQSYAPVDGVEIQCSPKIWKTPEVVSELKKGLAANIQAISSPLESNNKYFALKTSLNEPINIIYLEDSFPSKIEISPASQALMVAEPVGTQEGMGMMGFCYVPYHFVYDLRFPVLMQIGDGTEIFQFPLVVDIDNNVVKNEYSSTAEEENVDVCSFADGDINVNTYDSELNPVSANVSYNCFDNLCDLGQTAGDGELRAKIPICVNGYLIASASGYAESKILFSSNSENSAEIVLEREYPLDVEVRLGGRAVRNVTAVVHFTGADGYSSSAVLPESSKVRLKEGLYSVDAFVYGSSNVIIPASRKTECFNVAKGGILGIFGSTREKCVDVEIPATKIDYALKGGGKLTDYYILGTELANGKIIVDVSELETPRSLEQLQYNYEVFNSLGLEVSFS